MKVTDVQLVSLVRRAIAAADFPVFLDSVSNPESLYFSEDDPRGLWRIILGTLPFIQDAQLEHELRHEIVNAPSDRLLECPFENECPLGFIVARNPCTHLTSLPDAAQAARTQGGNLEIQFNPVHVQMLPRTLDLVFVTCMVNGVTGKGKIGVSSVSQRILDQHRHLLAPNYSANEDPMTDPERFASTGTSISNEFANQRLLALRSVAEAELIKKRFTSDIFTRIPGNWFSTSVAQRAENNTTIESQLRAYPERFRKYLFFTEPENERDVTRPAEITDKALRDADKIPSLSRIAGPGLPCFPEIRSLLNSACLSLDRAGAAAIAFLVSAAVKPWEIGSQNLVVHPRCTIVERSVTLWQDALAVDTTIHRRPTNTFVSFTSEAIGTAMQRHLALPNIDLQAEATAWLEANSHGITISTLCTVLLHNLPLWTGMPASYYQLGIDSLTKNRPGWMHYIHYDPSELLPAITAFLQAEVDPGFICAARDLKTTGTALCPTSKCLSLLFDTAGDLARNLEFKPVEEMVANSNVVAAAARLAENLLTFTRNLDSFAPLELHVRKQVSSRDVIRLLREKGYLRNIVFTRSLRLLLLRLNHSLRGYLKMLHACGFGGANHVTQNAYWFLEYKDSCLTALPPTHRTVSQSIAAHPLTNTLEYLHRRAMRNYSNTVLRADRVLPEDAIQAIHDHFPSRARSPESPDSLQVPLMAQDREDAAKHLLTKLNLDWALL